MSRPVCSECLCVIDETGCGCVQPIEPFTNHEQGEKMNANELADNQLTHVIGENNNGEEVVIALRKPLYPESFVRQQQALINQLEETQDYLYKTHDTDKAEIEALKDKLDEAEQRYWNNK